VKSSIASGAGTDDVHKPTLWYYELLSFTLEQDVPRPSTDVDSLLSFEDTDREREESAVGCTEDTPPAPKKLKPSDVLQKICEQLDQPPPPPPTQSGLQAFANYVASKLEKVAPMQSAIAQKVISEVLFQAELGLLSPTACVVTDTTSVTTNDK